MMYNEKIANQTARRGGERMTIYNSQRPATAEEVYQDMCDRITNLQLKPGQKISENQMSEDYGVSRSVIRTVFTRLSQRKLIEVYPQRGTYVSKIDLDFIADLLLLRTAIEKEVLYEIFETMDESQRQELMVELKKNLEKQKEFYNSNGYDSDFKSLDSQFHKLMVDSVQRHNLMELMAEQMIHIARWRNFDVTFAHRVPELIEEHEAIYQAISENRAGKAMRAMSAHLETISKISETARAEYPEYFL